MARSADLIKISPKGLSISSVGVLSIQPYVRRFADCDKVMPVRRKMMGNALWSRPVITHDSRGETLTIRIAKQKRYWKGGDQMHNRRQAIKALMAGGIAGALRPIIGIAAEPTSNVETATVGSFSVGGTDDTRMLTEAFRWLQGARNRALVLEHKRYVISARIALIGARAFQIEGNGAVIAAANGMPVRDSFQILYFNQCTDGTVANLSVDGNRANRRPAEVPAHSVQIDTGCASLTFRQVHSNNAPVDGFYVGTETPNVFASLPTDVQLYSCGASNAFRNNVSVINSNRFRDYDGVYLNANGTLPMAGVDFEPDNQQNLGNIDAQCFRTRCSGNKGLGFQVERSNTSATLRNVVADANGLGAVAGAWGYLRIDGITIDNYGSSVHEGIINAMYMSGETHISNVVARNCNPGSNSTPIVYVHPTSLGPITIDNVKTLKSTRMVFNGSKKAKVTCVQLEDPSIG